MKYAIVAHKGQYRRYTKEPYIVHPFAVAGLVSSVTNNPEIIAAAFLHDVVEDTICTIENIKTAFGTGVSGYVNALTSLYIHGTTRDRRKEEYRRQIAYSSPGVKTIKLADLIDNTRSIKDQAPGFAKVYMAEKALLMDVVRAGDPALYGIAESIIKSYYKGL